MDAPFSSLPVRGGGGGGVAQSVGRLQACRENTLSCLAEEVRETCGGRVCGPGVPLAAGGQRCVFKQPTWE